MTYLCKCTFFYKCACFLNSIFHCENIIESPTKLQVMWLSLEPMGLWKSRGKFIYYCFFNKIKSTNHCLVDVTKTTSLFCIYTCDLKKYMERQVTNDVQIYTSTCTKSAINDYRKAWTWYDITLTCMPNDMIPITASMLVRVPLSSLRNQRPLRDEYSGDMLAVEINSNHN